MRRGRDAAGLVAVMVAVAVAAAGCSTGPTVGDGVLGVDWAVLPEPVVATPPADLCTARIDDFVGWDLPWSDAPAVECANEHESETFHVGTLTDADAGADLPELGDDLFQEAYAACGQQADSFLGGDHRTARVFLTPVLPTARQWLGGARWYRCEFIEIKNAQGAVVKRTASLRDGLRGSKPMAITCANQKASGDYVQQITFVGCRTAHDVELTGVYTAPEGPYPGHEKITKKALDACYGISATYLGMTRSALDSVGGISWTAWGSEEDGWSAGDRSFWCFMGQYPSRKLKGSIKNHPPDEFPH